MHLELVAELIRNIIFLITPSTTIQNRLSKEILSFHLSFSQCFEIIHLNMGNTPEYCCSSKWSWQQLSADRVYRPDATTYCGFHSPKGILKKSADMICSGNKSQYYPESWARETWLKIEKFNPPHGWSAGDRKGKDAESTLCERRFLHTWFDCSTCYD